MRYFREEGVGRVEKKRATERRAKLSFRRGSRKQQLHLLLLIEGGVLWHFDTHLQPKSKI